MLLLAEHRQWRIQQDVRGGLTDQDFVSRTDMMISFTTVGHDLELTGKDEAYEPNMLEEEWII